MIKARVYVTLKKSVFDPQGTTVHEALLGLGYATVQEVRQGKFFELVLTELDPEQARASLQEIATRVLANPVIESARVELLP